MEDGSGDNDLLFRLGFEDHPQAGSKLESLAKAVEMTQERIDRVFRRVGDTVQTTAERVAAITGAGSGMETAADRNLRDLRESVKTAAADFRTHADRMVAVQEEMAAKFEEIRQRNLKSAEASADKLEEIAKRQLDAATQAADAAKAAAERVSTAVGADPQQLNTPGASIGRFAVDQRKLIDLAQQNAAARVRIEQEAFEKIGEMRRRDLRAAEAAAKRIQELAAASRQVPVGGGSAPGAPASPANQPADSSDAIEKFAEQQRRMIELAQAGASERMRIQRELIAKLREMRVDDLEATAAAQQRSGDLHSKAAREATTSAQRSAEEQRLINEAIIVMERKSAEERLRVQRQLAADLETIRRAEAAKAAPRTQFATDDLAAEAEAATRRVVDIGRKAAAEEERIREDALARQKQMAAGAAEPWIAQYDKEVTAHDRAMREMARGRKNLVSGLTGTATALGTLTRGVVLLGLAKGEEMEKVLQKLAAVQSAIDMMAGAGSLMRNVAQVWESLRLITLGNVKAKQAEAAAGKLATASSADLTRALTAEALSANRAAAAHVMLARARGGGAVAGAAGNAAGGAAQTAAGGLGSRIAGGAIGNTVMAGAGRVAAGVGATAIGGSLGMLAAAATAAAGGLAFAGKAALDFSRDSRRSGIGGGSEAGSFADTVGGSRWNPFSALIAWSERAELAQAEERTKRMEHLSKLHSLEMEHQRQIADLRHQAETEARRMDTATERRNIDRRAQFARSPEERMELNRQAQVQAQRDIQASQDRLGDIDSNVAPDSARREIDNITDAQQRLADLRQQQLQLELDAHAERRRMAMEEIKQIEDRINARAREQDAMENAHRSAKARFGAMSELDQRRTLAALERMRQDPTGASQADADLVRRNLDTDESRRLVEQRDIARAERMGFDERIDPEMDQRRRAMRQEQDRDFDELAEKSEQDRKDLERRAQEGRAAGSANVEIVDRRQFEIKADTLERELIDRMLGEIEELMSRRDQLIKEGIQRMLDENLARESGENQARQAEINARL